MSYLMTARMGHFEFEQNSLAEAPNDPFDAIGKLGDRFQDASHLATINWMVAAPLGIPAKPFEVEICRTPLHIEDEGWVMDGNFTLRATDNFTLRLTDALRKINVSELFCILLRCNADDPKTEIFAIDAALNEIPETRQSAMAPNGTAFFGPGVLGLRSTGTVTIEYLAAYGISDRDRAFELLATVAPAISGIPAYDLQHYLGVGYSAADGLNARLLADGLARQNGAIPQSRVLETFVHREPAMSRAKLVLALEPIQMLESQFGPILSDPEWSYPSSHVTAGAEFRISPSKALQQLALAGPVEATSLGSSVTIPIPAPYRYIASPEALFKLVENTDYSLPLALIRITGHHEGPSGPIVTQVYAGLTFCRSPSFTAHVDNLRRPAAKDLPGVYDVQIILGRQYRSLAFFPDLSDRLDRFPEDGGRPRAFLASGNSSDQTSSGLPQFVAGPLDLPLDAPTDQIVVIHGRDIFGRWADPAVGSCYVGPLPVQSPKLYQTEVEYGEFGKIFLSFRISWDWSLRTPFDIRIASVVGVMDELDLADGINLPSFPPASPLSIVFDGDEPRLKGNQVPAGAQVASVPLALEVTTGDPPPDQRVYAVRIPIGTAVDFFEASSSQQITLAVDAWELVGAHIPERRSQATQQQVRITDPRAPVINGGKWELIWASRPDGGNLARAYFDLQQLSKGPVAGYYAWRTHDAAVLDLVGDYMPGDEKARSAFITGVLATRDRRLRLSMIRAAVEPHLHKANFRKAFIELFEVERTSLSARDIEIEVPGSQPGIEFVMFSAESTTGVASDRLDLSNLYAVAVPSRSKLTAPALRLLIPDSNSPLAVAGCVLAVVSAQEVFDAAQARFFWDDGEVVSSEEMLHSLEPQINIDVVEAERLVPGTVQFLAGDPYLTRQYFILRSPPRWGAQHFACSLSKLAGDGGSGNVLTPRSSMVSVHIVPAFGPRLEAMGMVAAEGAVDWTVSISGIDGSTYDTFAPSLIQLDLVDSEDASPTALPIKYSKFLVDGAVVASVIASAKGPGELQVRHPVDLAGKVVRIAVSDPAGRFDVLYLRQRNI